MKQYFEFIKNNGRYISEAYPGSQEVALIVKDALKALELLEDSQIEILGGDMFSEKDNKLIYAHQLWGSEYHYLNWYSERKDSEPTHLYLERMYHEAKENIIIADAIARRLHLPLYVAFVLK